MTFRVLVVDDNPDHRFLTQRALAPLRQSLGVEVALAEGGLEAVASARAVRPDLVLVDVKMPGIDGFETLVRIRAALQPKPPRVVMLTSSENAADKARAAALGADGFVTKPIDAKGFASVVRATVEEWVARSRRA
jgi:CheY-like chemotaxis protein